MSSTNESDYWIRKYFGFLVDDYGLEYYDPYSFCAAEIVIQILLGHKTPRIDFNKQGESELYKLDVEWVIKFFHGTFPSENHDYLKHNLKTNLIFISEVFKKNADRLINDFDTWWLPAHLFFYRTIEEQYKTSGQTHLFLQGYQYYYDYLKREGAI